MALPIAATPVLEGEDARRFLEQLRNPKKYTPPPLDYEKIYQNVMRRYKELHGLSDDKK